MNNVTISGRLAATPELKNTSTGKSVINFCVACRRNKDTTDWIDCVAWERTAALISQHFTKGSWIEVSGSIQTRAYESNGQKRKAVEISVSQIGFGGGKPEGAIVEIEEGELPF